MIFITFWTNFQFGPRLWVAVCSCKANVTEFDPQEVHQLFSFQDRCQWVRFPYGPPKLELNICMNDNKPFCIAPWVSLQYGGLIEHGGATPCCDWDGLAYKGNLKDYFTSEWLTNIKQAMIVHDYNMLNQTCKSCIETERVGSMSIRQRLLNDETIVEKQTLSIVDYRPDNLCNLKCRMCFSYSSSLIAKENNEIIKEYNTDNIYDIDFSTVDHLKIVGGEPSISKKVHDFLQWLIDHKFNTHIELTITTNATNANPKWMSLITQFKNCYAIVSIDAVGPAYEYIRTNADWRTVSKNSKIYKKNNIDTTFQITGSMYNIPVIEKWVHWFKKKTTCLYPVEGHEYLTLAALPDDIRDEKLEFLKNINRPTAKIAREMLSTTRFDRQIWERFVEYTNRLDRIRKTDIRQVDPIFERIMNYNG
jgi:organic radical activating enzyme